MQVQVLFWSLPVPSLDSGGGIFREEGECLLRALARLEEKGVGSLGLINCNLDRY